MSDASKSTLSLATIAVCLAVMVPCLVLGTQSYDGILETQKQLLKGQQEQHDWIVALSKKVDGHDEKLLSLQQSLDESLAKNALRDKRFQDRANN